jgi:hypothetical protein
LTQAETAKERLWTELRSGSRKSAQLCDHFIRVSLAQKSLAEHPHTDQQTNEQLKEDEETYNTAISRGKDQLEDLGGFIKKYTDLTVQGPRNLVGNILQGVSYKTLPAPKLGFRDFIGSFQ